MKTLLLLLIPLLITTGCATLGQSLQAFSESQAKQQQQDNNWQPIRTGYQAPTNCSTNYNSQPGFGGSVSGNAYTSCQ